MVVYTPDITSRIQYIFHFILSDILGIGFRLTTDARDLFTAEDAGLNYSPEDIPGALWVRPAGLLNQTGTGAAEPEIRVSKGKVLLFPSSRGYPFDLFSAAFYLVTRYEEYRSAARDRHGRFPAQASLATRMGFLGEPVVDGWAFELLAALRSMFPQLKHTRRQVAFLSTIDIDVAWAYRGKPAWRIMASTLGDLFSGRFARLKQRFMVVAGKQPDPYDVYDYLLAVHERYNIHPLFFFQVGNYGRYDRNVPAGEPAYRRLIRQLMERGTIGLHPSYVSAGNEKILRKEISTLADVTGMPVVHSRQHYLKITLPDSYRHLLKNGIREDYSLGYASLPGFRAGTCTPFFFYDLENESQTLLKVFPITFMDGTLNEYMHLSPDEAVVTIRGLIDKVRKVNGTFHSLWHNHSLSETGHWKGWRKVYEEMLRMAGMEGTV